MSFKYSENNYGDSLLLFDDLENNPNFFEIIDICMNIGITKVICICGQKI